jgi:hypothetical protein
MMDWKKSRLLMEIQVEIQELTDSYCGAGKAYPGLPICPMDLSLSVSYFVST